jgi:hypothetical protein
MTSRAVIASELKKLIENPKEPKVVVVRGLWGTGKTFMVRSALKKLEPKSMSPKWSDNCKKTKNEIGIIETYRYVSLFGKNSITDVKQGLCFDQSEINYIKKGIADLFSISRGFIEKTTGISFSSETITSFLFSRLKNSFICIDDFERKGNDLGMADIMGLVSHLKEILECTIILIVNEKELDDEDQKVYLKYSEKIIDLTFTFDPDPKENVDIFIGKINKLYQSIVRERCDSLCITNLRTITKIVRYIDLLNDYFKKLEFVHCSEIISVLILFMWIHDNQHNKDVPSKDILFKDDIFVDLSDIDGMIYTGQDKENDQKVEGDRKWRKLLNKYGFSSWDEDQDAPLMFLVEHGYFQKEGMDKLVSKKEEIQNRNKLKLDFYSAGYLFSDSFDHNFEDASNAIYNSTINAIFELDAKYVDSAVHILRTSGYEDLANKILVVFENERKEDNLFLNQYTRILTSDRLSFKDEKFLSLIKDMMRKYRDSMLPQLTIENILKQNHLTPGDIDYLSQQTVESFEGFFKNLKGNLEDCLKLLTFRNATEQNKKTIDENVTKALIRIRDEHPMQKARLLHFGIEI